VQKLRRKDIRAIWIAAAAVVLLAGLSALAVSSSPVSADPPGPHIDGGPTTDSCAGCHRTHTGQNEFLAASVPQSALCFACHDGTGSNYNVASEYQDPDIPANDATTSSFYSHTSADPSAHTSARLDEFAGVTNRHSECTDCHSPHTVTAASAAPTDSGWLASGAQANTTGVAATAPLTWKDPLAYEYELCLKCHSGYTQLLSYTQPSEKKTDKAAEIDPSNASYHPIRSPGKNTTPAMENSLAGGTLWRYTTASTIRCVNCHASSSRLAGAPAFDGKLGPHASENRGLLLGHYRDRDLKPAFEAYSGADFQLCFLCHSEAPFNTSIEAARPDTNFRLHGKHLTNVQDPGGGSLDIDSPGGGEGNAICAECHFELHSTRTSPWAQNQTYSRGVSFSPNVQPRGLAGSPQWSGPASRTCTLVCHGNDHNGSTY
jgi:predicted CXXCH cytochrome family protein